MLTDKGRPRWSRWGDVGQSEVWRLERDRAWVTGDLRETMATKESDPARITRERDRGRRRSQWVGQGTEHFEKFRSSSVPVYTKRGKSTIWNKKPQMFARDRLA